METKYVAIYRKGRTNPFSAIEENMAGQMMQDFMAITGKNYYTEPITREEALEIKKDTTRFDEPEFDRILERILQK